MPFAQHATVMMAVSAHALQVVNPPLPKVLSLLSLVKAQWFATVQDQAAVDGFIRLNSTTPEKVAVAIGDGTLTSQAVNLAQRIPKGAAVGNHSWRILLYVFSGPSRDARQSVLFAPAPAL